MQNLELDWATTVEGLEIAAEITDEANASLVRATEALRAYVNCRKQFTAVSEVSYGALVELMAVQEQVVALDC